MGSETPTIVLVTQAHGEPKPAELHEAAAGRPHVRKVIYLHSRTGAWVHTRRIQLDHEPVLVYFDPERVTKPAEVCWGCSDQAAGRWVPVTQCAPAAARLAVAEAAGELSRTATIDREGE